jgi:8-oxo-dGTP pyrophosphatase MutT (NUDIX family)
MEIPGFRPAAVLVPILRSESGLELLFTVRGQRLTHHAGQIAFPGGGLEPGESPEEAALRETREEIGLEVPMEAVLGRLDDHPSPARFIATPVVAWVAWPQPLEPNPSEVAEVFSVPLADLAAIVPTWEERTMQEYRRRIHFYTWGERLIWGFTGNLVKELLGLLDDGESQVEAGS